MIKNVLKEDFYRLKRSKTLWICLTVAVVFSFLITTFYNFAIELAGEYGVYTGVDLNEYMAPELMAAMAFLNAELPIFCMIFAAALVAGEFAQGTLRQILASGAGRVGVYFSKWLKVFVASVFLYVATVVVSLSCGTDVLEAPNGLSRDYVRGHRSRTAGIGGLFLALCRACLYVEVGGRSHRRGHRSQRSCKFAYESAGHE